MKSLLLAFLLIASPALAQLPTEGERKIADYASYGTVAVSLALDVKYAWDSPRRGHDFAFMALRDGVTYGGAELIKKLTHRERPCVHLPELCGVDPPDADVPSLHTAWPFSTLNLMAPRDTRRIAVSLTLGSVTGLLRNGAGKHDAVGVLTGAALGFATSFIR